MTSFETHGFLSDQTDAWRSNFREQHAAVYENAQATIVKAITLINDLPNDLPIEKVAALGMWYRCIESCQATILLVERGLPSARWATLRAAYECLFFACALWDNPDLWQLLENEHHIQRTKQARGMLREGFDKVVAPHAAQMLKSVAAEVAPKTGLSAHDAARHAGLLQQYEMIYRGASLAGGHATLRSLDSQFDLEPDGSLTSGISPTDSQAGQFFRYVIACLALGIQRLSLPPMGAASEPKTAPQRPSP